MSAPRSHESWRSLARTLDAEAAAGERAPCPDCEQLRREVEARDAWIRVLGGVIGRLSVELATLARWEVGE